MLNVAVLDDYQNVTKKFGNWSELEGKINLKIFNKYFDDSNELVKYLLKIFKLILPSDSDQLPNFFVTF